MVNSTNPALNFTYNGKEFEESLNLNTFDLGARHMDPAIGRFMVIDPMTDFFNNQSPYAMANNNPIANVDYHGFGILNAIGNIFKRIGNGVKKLFSGNSCSCSKPESLADAFKRPDFGWYKSHKGSSTRYGNSRRPRGGVRPVASSSAGLVSLRGASMTSSEVPRIAAIPVITPPKPPTRRPISPIKIVEEEEEEQEGGVPDIGINYFNIPFFNSTTTLKDRTAAVKILSDLIKTLKEYPQLKVIVEGRIIVSKENIGKINLNTKVKVNGGSGPVEWLTGGRANAIIKILRGQGVNASQIIKGKGAVSSKVDTGVEIRQAK